MIWAASGFSVAMPSRTAYREPARLTTNVLPEIPARPRDKPASMMPADRPDARIASAMPRSSRSRMSQGRLRGDVARRHAGAADRHHQVHSPDDGGVQRVADLHLVGGDGDHAVDDEPGLGEQLGDQRPAVVLVAVRGPVVNNDDQCPADQLRTLFHGCNRISGVRPRRGDSHHCCALPNVTCTVLVSPDGSL